jgi:hypothetical protein
MTTGDPYLKAYIQSTQGKPLQAEIAEVWQSVRQKSLYSGQPRSAQSDHAVARALLALKVASQSNDRFLIADASRLLAHTLNAAEQYEQSLEHYRKALDLFESVGAAEEAARTRLGFMAALYMMGRYQESLETGDAAERWFKDNNHITGLAKIHTNKGNLYYRRELYQQALQHHSVARKLFEQLENWNGLAMTYLNIGNCLCFTDMLSEADDMYKMAEELGARLGMQEFFMQARYNRSYLMFLRERCTEALDSLSAVRDYFKRTGSERHMWLCNLDISEIYLHLLKTDEAITLARSAATGFEKLGMCYEQAKALTFCGIGLVRKHKVVEAEKVVVEARLIFERDANRYWISVLDFCLGYIRLELGDVRQARILTSQARLHFADLELRSSMADSLNRLASIALQSADVRGYDSRIDDVLKLTVNKRR